ncbi:MAG TPA: endolytic transglycosylase MltG [Pseudonocardiaceae bacterium]|nr:endolytic transglycosylase MltG [Pseudonocardiaceae bacterium]
MNDGLELFDDLSEDDRHSGNRRGRGGRRPRRRRRRGLTWSIVLVLVLVIAAGAYLGVRQFMGIGVYPDYVGSGDRSVVFQVNAGDTTSDIGDDMRQADIVKSSGAFVKAGESSSALASVQPGFYVLKEHMSGAAAVSAITNSHNRVGLLEIKSGQQLDDTTSVTHKVTAGILTHISQASCATLNGKQTCVSVAQLRAAIADTDPAALGVPDWAIPSATSADPKHRLEGLIMPGVYNLKPGETAAQTLKRIMDQSSAQLQAAGLPSTNQQSSGFTPYQVLTLASIVEREAGTAADMPKISRVFYNRLQQGMDLQSDATVDYGLDRPMVATSPAERPASGAYNTYGNSGLPPTPVSSPSTAAIEAASQPAAGPWIYFVVCQKDGSSCFATNLTQHNANVQIAIHNGVF